LDDICNVDFCEDDTCKKDPPPVIAAAITVIAARWMMCATTLESVTVLSWTAAG
jgi:hypothetical protein